MLGGSRRNVPGGATFWIVVPALIFVGAIAFAIPPAPSQDGLFAVAMTEKDFVAHGDELDVPILIADQLDAGAVRAAREAVDGNYLVAGIAIPDQGNPASGAVPSSVLRGQEGANFVPNLWFNYPGRMLGPTVGRLGERTLVLNRSWLAITTTTVRRALSLLYQESAHAICPRTFETHDFDSWAELQSGNGDRYIRTVTSKLRVPEIIVLRMYDGLPKRTVAFSRRNLYRRDNFTCQYCGRRPGSAELTIDHVTPRSQGGRTTWENCVLACVECNKRKAHRSRTVAGMQLLRAPRAPQWSWDVELSLGHRCDCWSNFLPRHGQGLPTNGRGASVGGNGRS